MGVGVECTSLGPESGIQSVNVRAWGARECEHGV